jgi:hypothetical protein
VFRIAPSVPASAGFPDRKQTGSLFLLATDKALLNARDPALRRSFYSRFQPVEFPAWIQFADSDQDLFGRSASEPEFMAFQGALDCAEPA